MDILFVTLARSTQPISNTLFTFKMLNRLTKEWSQHAKDQVYPHFDETLANHFEMINRYTVESSPIKSHSSTCSSSSQSEDLKIVCENVLALIRMFS